MPDFQRIVEINQVFTPGAPVQTKDLFSGRQEQLTRAIEAVTSPGRHPVIFGQRGVGKTSLANVLNDVLQSLQSVKISCDGGDTFSTIWSRVFATASVSFKQQAMGFARDDALRTISLGEILGHDPKHAKPAEIAEILNKFNTYSVVMLDEFDKITDVKTKSAFADTIKILSDSSRNVTLILVGVAKNIHELIGGHPSIDRNLVQIDMPLMDDEEIMAILNNGFAKLDMTAQDGVLDQVPLLTSGYPHYAHLLGLCSAKACAHNATDQLTHDLFDLGCNMAIMDAIEKYRDVYAQATMTTQPSRYPVIPMCMWLCALRPARRLPRH